jgi:hypothetical protein
VIKSGLSEYEAKVKLCCAMAERKIAVRVKISTEYGVPGRVFGGSNVFVPNEISHELFDWVGSRPLRPWSIGPGFGEHHWRSVRKDRPIDLLVVSSDDLDAILSGEPSRRHRRAEGLLQMHRKRQTADNKMTAVQVVGSTPVSTEKRSEGKARASQPEIERFVANYVIRKKREEKPPTQSGLVQEWAEAGNIGHRDTLRNTLKLRAGAEVGRGRPRKSPPKSAEK